MNVENFRGLLAKYKFQGIIVDTNLMVLLLVGIVNRDRITKFKRTSKFQSEDYDLLLEIVDNFSATITTSNILTEVDNLIDGLLEPEKSQCRLAIKNLLISGKLREEYVDTNEVVRDGAFLRLGIGDTSIIRLSVRGALPQGNRGYLLITIDSPLVSMMESRSLDVINFNHLRYGQM